MKFSIFKTFLLSVLIVAQVHFAYAQTASILPPAKTTFLDSNGKPLTSGTVDFYIPSTTTRKTTWQDAAETIPNTNPVVLDAAGRALILGSGTYRQVVKDRLNNTIWDQVTSSVGSGGGGGTAATGDGDLVGTIKPWAGMTAPNQYMLAYGEEVSRVTFSVLFTAITSAQAVFCTSGSPTLNGLGDTSNFWIGSVVEVSCLGAGFSTIISKTATTVTLAANANVTTNTIATFLPWGRGNGTTTFNLPDLRGVVIAGNNIMGGIASTNLSTTYFGAQDPNSSGGFGGNQSDTLITANFPPYTPAGSVVTAFPGQQLNVTGGATGAWGFSGTTNLNGTFFGTPQGGGGIAVSATVVAGGASYPNGPLIVSTTGGTCSIQPTFSVTVVGNAITAPVVSTPGLCTVAPSNNNAVFTSGAGSGGTIFVTYSALPFSLLQPTKTANYIIKVTPDQNSATASGVTSLGLMTGSIACGANITCTGNIISAPTQAVPAPTSVALGGVFSKTCSSSNWFNILDTTGTFGCSQPNFTDLLGTIAIGQIPNSLITYAKLQNGSAKSVLGVTGNAGAALADIVGTANQWFGANAAGTGVSFQTLAGDCTGPITAIICLNVNGVALTTNATAAVGQLPGETSTGNAAAGKVGEYIEGVVLVGAATALVNATSKTVTSVSLTAGDWDIDSTTYFVPAASTSYTVFGASQSLVTNVQDSAPGRFSQFATPAVVPTAFNLSSSIPPARFSLSGVTSIFLVATANFTVSTMSAYGIIRARRAR